MLLRRWVMERSFAGQPASADWPETMNGLEKPSLDYITSRSPS